MSVPGVGHLHMGSSDYLGRLRELRSLGIVGHGVMRLVAGPAREDRLARWPWKAA